MTQRSEIGQFAIGPDLKLSPIDAIPATAAQMDCVEELIDTILLANLQTVAQFHFGKAALFLFFSGPSWAACDVAAVIESGEMVCFENKNGTTTYEDLQKFARDVAHIEHEGLLYVAHRWQHHKDNFALYRDMYWPRMCAAFFLNVRTSSTKETRDLEAEAACTLGVSRERFHQSVKNCSSWLKAVQGKVTRTEPGHYGLYDYLKAEGFEINPKRTLYVLHAPRFPQEIGAIWRKHSLTTGAATILLASYQFYSTNARYPTHITLTPINAIS